jgi:bis(5'-nucleosidyl)-tetraphosphatase
LNICFYKHLIHLFIGHLLKVLNFFIVLFVFIGHVDPGESEWQAALREVKEEAGIDQDDKLSILKDFKHEMFYRVKSELKRVYFLIIKLNIIELFIKVTYWLARLKDDNLQIKISHEHQDWRWVKLSDALELVEHDEMKKLLKEANIYIDKNVG